MAETVEPLTVTVETSQPAVVSVRRISDDALVNDSRSVVAADEPFEVTVDKPSTQYVRVRAARPEEVPAA